MVEPLLELLEIANVNVTVNIEGIIVRYNHTARMLMAKSARIMESLLDILANVFVNVPKALVANTVRRLLLARLVPATNLVKMEDRL